MRGRRPHDGIVGEWIRWWIDINPDAHMVINPAPYIKGEGEQWYSADILFLEKIDGDKFMLTGVAEVENNRRNWFEKLESLKAYVSRKSRYSNLKFVLLCVSVYSDGDKNMFNTLMEKIRDLSKRFEIDWILYRLNLGNKEDPCSEFRDEKKPYLLFILDAQRWLIKSGDIKSQKA
ncbi:MAG: hypothetical protein QXU21_08480 [Candidatus Bathyarchaeia archaeon]